MPKVTYTLEKKEEPRSGVMIDTLVKTREGQEPEALLDVLELEDLFDACVRRWGDNWDLNKLKTCIAECEFD